MKDSDLNYGNWSRMQDAVPVMNVAAGVSADGGNTKVVIRQKRQGFIKSILRWIVPFHPEKTVLLDKTGTRVMEMCDGRRTVGNIVDQFAVLHRLTFHEARAAVTHYIRLLIQRGVLAIEISKGLQEQDGPRGSL